MSGDIFEGIVPGAMPFARPAVSPQPVRPEKSLELGGPWNYFAEFRRAHGLTNLPHPEPPEIALQAPGTLLIPLWLQNETAKAEEITLTATLPAGWTAESGIGKFLVASKQAAATRIEVKLPALAENAPRKNEPQEITVQAESNRRSIGEVKLRVELRKRALPQ
jgi:hypothetical protein